MNKSESIATASPRYENIRELIGASLQRKPYKNSHGYGYNIYNFVDPAFDKFVIRASSLALKNLKNTTSLTPAEYIFHGPNIATPLMSSQDKKGRSDFETAITIMARQPGISLDDIQTKYGQKKLAERLAKHPEEIDHLFRLVAFVGLYEKTANPRGSLSAIDINTGNIFLTEDGKLSLIDQMSPEDIEREKWSDHPNYQKAKNSIAELRKELSTIVENGLKKGLSQDDMLPLRLAIRDGSTNTNAKLDEVIDRQYIVPRMEWEHLRPSLSDPHTEQWRGLSDGPVRSAYFQKTHDVSANAMSMDKTSPQTLLNRLNKLYNASIARAL